MCANMALGQGGYGIFGRVPAVETAQTAASILVITIMMLVGFVGITSQKLQCWKAFDYDNFLDDKNAVLVLKGGLVSNNANSYTYVEKFYKHIEENHLNDPEKKTAFMNSNKFDNFLEWLLKEDKILTKKKWFLKFN